MDTRMILHFNYHVSGIFYGIDVVKPGSNGQEPTSLFIIRSVFYHLPFLWIVMIMYTNSRLADLALVVISGIYAIANAFHVFGELTKEEKKSITNKPFGDRFSAISIACF